MPAELEPRDLALLCARCADLRKAENLRILDMRGLSSVTDFFVLATGNNEPHVRAIWNEIARRLKKDHGLGARTPEGGRANHWVVLDYYDVVVHVMHRDQRQQYDLDTLWNDAPQVPLPVTSETPA
tara:strand:- start:811 stop:1188 length:378 start_codon:yes stop_codon:yes gene_type:complete